MRISRHNLLSYSGRASRSEYWRFTGPVLAMLACALLYDLLIIGPETYQRVTTHTDLISGQTNTDIATVTEYSPGTASLIVSLLVVVPFTLILTRRVHDIGYPSWYAWSAVFLAFFCGPILSGFVSLIALVSMPLALTIAVFSGVPQVILSALAFVVIVLWGTTPSEPGDNEYGPEPKGALT